MTTKKVDSYILEINKVICGNIEKFDISERGLLSQNIMSQLRNFIEHIALKIYSNGQDIEISYHNIEKAITHIKQRGDLKFLSSFHKFLQPVASHYTLDGENSERLMLKYYEYLLKIKSYLKKNYALDVLENIDRFPVDTDSSTKEYYEKIAIKIDRFRIKNLEDDRYYIQKIKPFFVNCEVYYEVTFTRANDMVSKFDRIIAFTKLDILHNYAVKLYMSIDNIEILGKKMPIHIIDRWEVSIRPCEVNNFASIFNIHLKTQTGSKEYQNLMTFLAESGLSLAGLVGMSDEYYQKIKEQITANAKVSHIFTVLDKCHEVIKNNHPGCNVISYLLYRLNNKIIKQQHLHGGCHLLSNLSLSYGCIPFEQMPFDAGLLNHNPKISDLFDCIDPVNREHELFARFIKNNTEKGELYTAKKDLIGFENIDILINIFNSKLYKTHTHRRLETYKDFIYINGYEADTIKIINRLKELSVFGIKNYSSSVDSWLNESSYYIDCNDKKTSLRQMFEKSNVALIYGSAGTGKSTMISHVSQFFNNLKKLYLAHTNPAIDNLKRKVHAQNGDFKTIAKFLASRHNDTKYDLLIIDECSIISNMDMLKVLEKASPQLLVLVGDVFQIESIRFGNWFAISKSFIPETSTFELTIPYRTKNNKLLELWGKVRNIEDDILEHIAKNNYSTNLDDSIFEHSEEDEIILCLNYDGLYGINNINRFLQNNNDNTPKKFGNLTYKVGDPVLFNDTKRFGQVIYNNLKGRIVAIEAETFDDKIQFDIEIDKSLNGLEVRFCDFKLIDNPNNKNSIIRFFVNKYRSTDDDDDESSDAVVPFQIAYAVSIHKAQGLEYDSVKIVITHEVEEMITHDIFYTAITRAKEKLKIYWSPETSNKVLKGLQKRNNNRDVALLSSRLKLK